jgi:hypothetical protein
MSVPTNPPNPADLSPLERLQAITDRVEGGDASVLPEPRQEPDAHHPDVWPRHGGLDLPAQAAWLNLLAGPNLLLRESVERKLEEMRAELTGDDPTPLRQLLVERVLACWLQTAYVDAVSAGVKEATPAQRAAALRIQKGCHRRHLQTIQALATMR